MKGIDHWEGFLKGVFCLSASLVSLREISDFFGGIHFSIFFILPFIFCVLFSVVWSSVEKIITEVVKSGY